jgi:hypothetical protein
VYKDSFVNLKHYDEAWDLTNITLIHRLYQGKRRWLAGEKAGTIEKIQQWGPYQFKCDACGLTRQTYAMITKHQQTCKHMVG